MSPRTFLLLALVALFFSSAYAQCSGNCQSAEFQSTNSAATGIAFSFAFTGNSNGIDETICSLYSGTLNNDNIGHSLDTISGTVSTITDPNTSQELLIAALNVSFSLSGASDVGTLSGTITYSGDVITLSTMVLNYQSTTLGLSFTNIALVVVTQDTCSPPSTVGDPQFVGLRGQSYQVHGIDGAVYNLISDKQLQVNSRFVFLREGKCPVFDGVADSNCWSHPGSYMGEMSFQVESDGKLHAALLQAGSAKQGFVSVQVDGKPVAIGSTVSLGSFSLEAVSSHQVRVETEQFSFVLSNSDMFINQQLRAKVPLSKLTAHGLIGQTHSLNVHTSSLRHIEGTVDDYSVADSDIFGTGFIFNRFQA